MTTKLSPKKTPTAKKTVRSQKVENAAVIARYFGFQNFEMPNVSREDKKKGLVLRKGCTFTHTLLPPVEETSALLTLLAEQAQKRSPSDPLMVYYTGSACATPKSKKSTETVFNLHVIGTPKSIADALLIKTSLSILEEYGHKEVTVELSNIGGKEAMVRFLKELTSYYRKHMSDMNGRCRQLFKDSTHTLVLCKDEINGEILENAPSPLNYLTDVNRDEFMEVIEYLESQNIPYEVDKHIIGDPHYSSNTIFSIVDRKSGTLLATGTRYNHLSKKIGLRKEIPATGATVRITKQKKVPASRLPKREKIRFCFMQIGTGAKMKSLSVIDTLRKAGVPVHQSLSRDRLSTQLQYAQRLRVPYLLIMGQKEALENSVVVRDTNTHKQTTVPVAKLADHLKGLK